MKDLASMTKQEFIDNHVLTCTAKPCKKYDPKKSSGALHSEDYSRRKCAKGLWRKMKKRSGKEI